jgi:hypothetical protein
MKIYIILFLAAALFTIHMQANASGWEHDHPHEHEAAVNGVDGQDGNDGRDGSDGMSSNKYNGGMAALMAADAIHCTTSSRKHQMGVGLGNSDGQNGAAVGYCNSVEMWNRPVMWGVKASGAEDTDNKYSIGLNWTW